MTKFKSRVAHNAVVASNAIVSDATLRKFIADVGKAEIKFNALKAEVESLRLMYSRIYMDIDRDSKYWNASSEAEKKLGLLLAKIS